MVQRIKEDNLQQTNNHTFRYEDLAIKEEQSQDVQKSVLQQNKQFNQPTTKRLAD